MPISPPISPPPLSRPLVAYASPVLIAFSIAFVVSAVVTGADAAQQWTRDDSRGVQRVKSEALGSCVGGAAVAVAIGRSRAGPPVAKAGGAVPVWLVGLLAEPLLLLLVAAFPEIVVSCERDGRMA